MGRRVGEDCLYLRNRQPEISGNIEFIHASLPIVNDFVGGHTGTLQHWAAALNAKLHFDKWAIGPIHHHLPLPALILAWFATGLNDAKT
jgi:hypothetical protein